jgi:PAS domain S-box-containing protein
LIVFAPQHSETAEPAIPILVGILPLAVAIALLLVLGGAVLFLRRDRHHLAAWLEERDFAERLLETVPAVIVLLDNLGRVRRVNDFFEKLTGFRREELHGKDWFSTMLPAHERLRVRALFADARADTPTGGNVNAILLRNGSELEIEWYDRVLRDKGGAPIGLLAIGLEITERKRLDAAYRDNQARMEQVLRESDALFRAAGRLVSMAVFRQDLDLRYTWMFSPQLGYTPEQVVGHTDLELLPAAAAARVVEIKRQVLETGTQQRETVSITVDGQVTYFDLFAEPARDAAGATIGLIGATLDITEQMRTEEQTRIKDNAIANSISAIAITGIDSSIFYVNPAFVRMWGYADERDILGLTLPELTTDSAEARHIIDLLMKSGSFVGTLTGRRKDGSTFPSEISASVVRNERGEVTHMMGSFIDIAERTQLQRAILDVAAREQRRLSQELHDGLGQELTGLSLMAQSMATAAKRGLPPTEPDLKRITELARRAVTTCRVIAHGLSPLATTRGRLTDALRELAGLYADPHGAVVRFEVIEAAPLRLAPDVSEHLYRITQEAFANALRHARAKVIEIKLDVQPASVRLEILDDGSGIADGAPDAGGLGFKIMRYRAAVIGAQLHIGAQDSGGTRVICECQQPPMASR